MENIRNLSKNEMNCKRERKRDSRQTKRKKLGKKEMHKNIYR